jgi:hypothetical protein
MLPNPIRQGFNLHWRPIFEVMEACPGLDVADEDLFEQGIALSKSRVEHVLNKRRTKPMQWELSTRSRHVQRSSIEKSGTESDKAALPTGTSRYNKPRKTGTFKRKRKASNHRRRSRQPPQQQEAAVAALPALLDKNSSTSSNEDELKAQSTTSRQRLRWSAATWAAAKVLASAQEDDDSSSNSSSDSSSSKWYKWESPPLEQPTARITKTVNIAIGSNIGSKESSTKGRGRRQNRNRGREQGVGWKHIGYLGQKRR